MSRFLKRGGIVVAVLAVAIQFLGPSPTNPPIDQTQALPTREVFDRSCSDCHSNRTRWPWYSHVAPASWLVVGHVDHARSHMNVSEWAGFTPSESDHMLTNMCKLARNGRMPLSSYLLLHHDAKLSGDDVASLCSWTEAVRRGEPGTGAAAPAASGEATPR